MLDIYSTSLIFIKWLKLAIIAMPIFHKNIREAFLLTMKTICYIQFG